jgi:hypothetical protein
MVRVTIPSRSKSPQGARKHLLRDAVDGAPHPVKASCPFAQEHNDKHTPLVPDTRQHLAHFPAIFTEKLVSRKGHIRVPRSETYAFL